MKKLIAVVAFLFAINASGQSTKDQPKLIIGIVVDQLRNDYLFRFEDLYGEGGFKRLRKDGFYGANHHFSYMPTTTGPGHASIYTGTTPSVHGIAGNNWYDPATKYKMYCAEDRSVKTVGADNADGQMSPRNLKTTTITDELKLFWNFRSKVLGVSLKDRGAVLPAGHLGNSAYWLSDGNFITSSYYMNALPQWVVEFNDRRLAETYLDQGWSLLLPFSNYSAGLADNNIYESTFAGEAAPVFPKNLRALAAENGGVDIIKVTPFGNSLTFEFALEAIVKEEMGKDEIPDFLAISLSSTDYIGHAYGPRAVEIQDTYLRLDADLAKFISALDDLIGKNNYTLFLTADHGAAEVPQFNIDNRLPGGYIDVDTAMSILSNATAAIHPIGMEMIEEVEGNKIFLSDEKLKEGGLEKHKVAKALSEAMMKVPGVYAAYPTADILKNGSSEFPLQALYRGLYPQLAGDVVWVLSSNWMEYGKTGTTHGSPWRNDTHIPLFFYGKGVEKGISYAETNIRDIASTLSMMLNIPLPSGSTGIPVIEAIEK